MAKRQKLPTIEVTTDYSIIKTISGNRFVNPKDVEIIMTSMQIKQLIVPAIVNEKMQLIDGQHRLAACIKLSLPFYFIQVDGYALPEVQQMNASMKNWKPVDFLDSFIELYNAGEKEFHNYITLQKFMRDTGLTLSASLYLSDITAPPGEITNKFKTGKFTFVDEPLSRKIALYARDFDQYDQTRWRRTTFLKVFASICTNKGYKHDKMMKNTTSQWNKLLLMSNELATRSLLLEIYNYNSKQNSVLFIDRVCDDYKEFKKNLCKKEK